MNKAMLTGRLTRDPDVRYSQGENQMCISRFTLAVDRRRTRNQDGNGQTADFISCVAFGKTGEFVEKYARKGMKFDVVGRIQTGSYQNKDGQTADFISCVAFGKTGEFVEKYARKGMKFDVVGRIQTGSYQNKEGQTVYTTDVVVEDIEFGESKKFQGGGSDFDHSGSSAGRSEERHSASGSDTSAADEDGFMNVPGEIDDDLPFN